MEICNMAPNVCHLYICLSVCPHFSASSFHETWYVDACLLVVLIGAKPDL